jgi:hypothetical protein
VVRQGGRIGRVPVTILDDRNPPSPAPPRSPGRKTPRRSPAPLEGFGDQGGLLGYSPVSNKKIKPRHIQKLSLML